MYCIYLHRNKINGKVYIGQTCQKPEYRWNGGEGYIESPYFYSAIKKYGWDNFEHIILEDKLTLDQANQKEIEYIEIYKSTDENFGYNIQKGGNSREVDERVKIKNRNHALELWEDPSHREYMSQKMKEKWQDPEYRKKQEEARKNKPHVISEAGRENISKARKLYISQHGTPTQGVGHTEEAKEKIREAKMGEKNPMYGKKHTEEEIQKIREKNSKAIQCIETGEIFPSRLAAAAWCGLKSATGISDCLKGKKKSAGKHPETGEKLHWKNIEE